MMKGTTLDEILVDIDLTDSNSHLHELHTFVANEHQLESASTDQTSDFQVFLSTCEDAFVNGDSELKIGISKDFTSSLKLRSIGVLIAGSIQRTDSRQRPLKALFDSGSKKTMLNFRALPKEANPTTVTGRRVTGVHGTHVLNQEVVIEDLVFPEFSPTQKVPGPIRATMFSNDDSAYDIIIGMDTMLALGIDVRCSTKTITWNDNQIPF